MSIHLAARDIRAAAAAAIALPKMSPDIPA